MLYFGRSIILFVIERRSQKEKREAENSARKIPEYNYGMEVAETLSRLAMRSRAFAKIKIQQLLLEIEFATDATTDVV